MINCFIDPIFLAIEDSVTPKFFTEVVFEDLYTFVNAIQEFESKTGRRNVKFNITFELILSSIEYNPYRFSSRISCSNWFRKFLSYFLKQHRNAKCDIISYNKNQEQKYFYQNLNVPKQIMNKWNLFLNNCEVCNNCNEKNLELISNEQLGSKIDETLPNFFKNIIIDLLEWLNFKINSLEIDSIPLEVDIEANLKKKGDWRHSHPKRVMKVIDKLLICKVITEIRPIGKTRGFNENIIKIKSHNQLEIYIKDQIGTQIFMINITARNNSEQKIILRKICDIVPNFSIK